MGPSWRQHSFLVLSTILSAAMAPDAQRQPPFRSNVDVVSLTVTVTGPDERYVSNLSATDFEIFEDGRPQDLTFFSPANTPLSVSLVIDSSASMEERMPLAQQAAMEFVAQLRPGDAAEVVDFDSQVEVVQAFTDDRQLLEQAIRRIRAGGSTSLYNAVYIVLRQVEKLRARVSDEFRRNVIVVLSDGDDTSSLVTLDELLDVTKRSQTVIYTIGLGLETTRATPAPSDGEFALRRLAQDTGGRIFTPKRPEDLSGVYRRIADELARQYVLGYLSRSERRDGGWRSIAVRVRRPQLQARTRTGYYGN